MEIETVVTGALDENCYILKKNNTCLVIDPGSDYPYHFCHFHDDLFSGRNIKMESPGSGSMSGNGRIFCIYEITSFIKKCLSELKR